MTPEALAHLHHAAFPNSRSWSAQEFSDFLASPHICLISNGDSFALGRVLGPEAELLTIAVHPVSQGQGKGRAILAQFESALVERDVSEIFLEVSALNTSAINLYKSMNYVETARRKSYYKHLDGTTSDALNFCKRLTKLT